MYAMVPDEMVKLPVTCVRFYPLPVDGDHAEQSHVVAASCKCSNITKNWTFSYSYCWSKLLHISFSALEMCKLSYRIL